MKNILYLIILSVKFIVGINFLLFCLAMLYVLLKNGVLYECLMSNFYKLLILVLGGMLVIGSDDKE